MASTYDRIGCGYAGLRRPDPRIEAQLAAALGDARTVVNVGAGTGSYEPPDRHVVAVEPSLVMIRQRIAQTPVVRAVAEQLPFFDGAFDAAFAVLTMHHWTDWRRGLSELQRIARLRVVVLTFDCDAGAAFWLFDYFPGILERDRQRFPPLEAVCRVLGARATPVPVPHDCTDGFLAAHWREPHAYLDERVRSAASGFATLTPDELERGLSRLERDLDNGAWDLRYGELLGRQTLEAGYRLLATES